MRKMTDDEFIALVSKAYVHQTTGCFMCANLPLKQLCEATVDTMFERRIQKEIVNVYAPYLPQDMQGRFWRQNVSAHKVHCYPDKFSDEDLQALGLKPRTSIINNVLFDLRNATEIDMTIAQAELVRQRLETQYAIMRTQLEARRAESDMLREGKMPAAMVGTVTKKKDTLDEGYYNLLVIAKDKEILDLSLILDGMHSDLQKIVLQMQRTQSGTTIHIQVAVSTIDAIMANAEELLFDIQQFCARLLPNQPEVVFSIVKHLSEGFERRFVPVADKAINLISTR